jgi:hypothetical protein
MVSQLEPVLADAGAFLRVESKKASFVSGLLPIQHRPSDHPAR